MVEQLKALRFWSICVFTSLVSECFFTQGDVIEGSDSAAVSLFGRTDGLYFSPVGRLTLIASIH